MKATKRAPIVKLNTNTLIKELVGEWNHENQDIIITIAKNESALIRGCNNMAEYKANIQAFIGEINR